MRYIVIRTICPYCPKIVRYFKLRRYILRVKRKKHNKTKHVKTKRRERALKLLKKTQF